MIVTSSADYRTVVNFVLPLTALVVTLIRLADRTRNRLLWWDDAWAFASFLLAIVFMTAVELHLQDPSRRIRISPGVMRLTFTQIVGKYTQSVKIAVYYM